MTNSHRPDDVVINVRDQVEASAAMATLLGAEAQRRIKDVPLADWPLDLLHMTTQNLMAMVNQVVGAEHEIEVRVLKIDYGTALHSPMSEASNSGIMVSIADPRDYLDPKVLTLSNTGAFNALIQLSERLIMAVIGMRANIIETGEDPEDAIDFEAMAMGMDE